MNFGFLRGKTGAGKVLLIIFSFALCGHVWVVRSGSEKIFKLQETTQSTVVAIVKENVSQLTFPRVRRESDYQEASSQLSFEAYLSSWEKKVSEQTITETVCMQPFYVFLPTFLDTTDRDLWIRDIPKPYGGCEVRGFEDEDAPSHCFYGSRHCSYVQTNHYARLSREDLGTCAGHRDLKVELVRDKKEQEEKCRQKTLVPIHIPQGLYFGHFLDDTMQRITHALAREKNRHEIILFGDHAARSPATSQILQSLNITKKIFSYDASPVCWKQIIWVCYMAPFHPATVKEAARYVREGIYGAAHRERLPSCTTRVYASRSASAINGRRPKNEREIMNFLKEKYGFTIFLGNESLESWTSALRHACILVGPHGGALQNLFWLNPAYQPAVIEMDAHLRPAQFWLSAVTLGLKYAWLSYRKGRVDLHRLDRLVTQFVAPLKHG